MCRLTQRFNGPNGCSVQFRYECVRYLHHRKVLCWPRSVACVDFQLSGFQCIVGETKSKCASILSTQGGRPRRVQSGTIWSFDVVISSRATLGLLSPRRRGWQGLTAHDRDSPPARVRWPNMGPDSRGVWDQCFQQTSAQPVVRMRLG